MISLTSELQDWGRKFEKCRLDTKKAMLNAILEKVIVYKDTIEITYNIQIQAYKEIQRVKIQISLERHVDIVESLVRGPIFLTNSDRVIEMITLFFCEDICINA